MTGIRPYHVDLGQRDVRTGMYDRFVFDSEGIPTFRYGGTEHYNPTFVGHYGLYQLGLYLRTRDEARLTTFLDVAEWFLRAGRSTPAGLTFEYTMRLPGLPTPWISALGQGRALSVLSRAYEATSDERYRDAALNAFAVFRKDVADGGVATRFPDGGVAFEEYPRAQPDIVLNGLITALFGLFDLAAIVPTSDPGGPDVLFREAVDSLERNLHLYDLSYWSAYDLAGRVCSNDYHQYHVILLWALHEMTGIDAFAERARRWDGFRRGLRLFVGRNLSRIKSRLPTWIGFAAVLLLHVMSPSAASSQAYPPGINWMELKTPHFRLIFPQELTGEAQSVANELEAVREPVSQTMDVDPARIPVVLNNRSVTSNGYVAFGPRRSVWESLPFLPGTQSPLGTGDWYSLLATHEYRHVAQLSRMNRGLTRIGRILFGEYGQAVSVNLSVPRWFLEGDAVGIESLHLPSGRGWQPGFDLHYRGLLMANQNYGYAKSVFRSYRDYVPGQYPYGFLVTDHIRRKYGEQALSDIAARAGAWSVFPLAFPIAVKTSTGVGVRRLHREAMAELGLQWSREREGLDYTTAVRRNTETKKRWTNFAHPRYVTERGILAAHSDLRVTAELVLLEPGAPTESLGDVDPALYFQAFDANADFVVWTQDRADPRFESQGYSVIMRRDLDGGGARALTRRTRLFGPSISPDARRVAAVGFDLHRASSIAVVDADTGTEVYRVADPEGRFISEVEWTRDGQAILAVVQEDFTKSIVELDLANYTWTELLPPTSEHIWSLADGDDHVYFVSDRSGIDNIYALDRRTGRRYQVTSRPLGAYYPDVSPDGSRIAYSDYTPDGFDVVEATLDPDTWLPVELIDATVQEEVKANLDVIETPEESIAYPIRSYRRVRDVLKFHSWLPTFDGRQAGLALSSTNLLNTTSATLVGLYDSRERTLVGAASAVVSRWYPVLSVEAIHGGRTSTHTTPGNVQVYSWMETGGRLKVDLPFTFERGIRRTSFAFGFSGGWFHITDRELVPFWHQGNGHLAIMSATASFSNARASAYADFRPPRAQSFYFSLQQTTGRSDYRSKQAYAAGALTFGGFARQHRFRLSGEAELERPENYRFASNLRYSRGYPYRYADNIVRGSAAYLFPAGYPDLAIGNFLYLPRMLGSVFYEYTWAGEAGSVFSTTGSFSSVGAELLAEFHLLSLPFPLSAGVRAVYRIEAKDYRVEPVIVLVSF